jgi:hypothetical protein
LNSRLVEDPKLCALVVDCIVQRLNARESLIYINRELKKDHKFFHKRKTNEIKARTLERVKRYLKDTRYQKLYQIAREGFVNQHLERIQMCEKIMTEYWKCYNAERDPSKKSGFLLYIMAAQPYLRQYYETTKDVMKHLSEINPDQDQDQDPDLPDPGPGFGQGPKKRKNPDSNNKDSDNLPI